VQIYSVIFTNFLKYKSEKNKSGSLEPDLLVVAVVTVLIRGSNRCGEFDLKDLFGCIQLLFVYLYYNVLSPFSGGEAVLCHRWCGASVHQG